jgi:thiol-disulfide isomerase/thioredoxin
MRSVHCVLTALLAPLLLSATALDARAASTAASLAVVDSVTGDSTLAPGSVVYVDFWASWCAPCRTSLPWMKALVERYAARGFQLVTVNLDRDPATAREFLDAIDVALPVVFDPEGTLARLYRLEDMPTSFLYGRDGSLRSRYRGFRTGDRAQIESAIRACLDERVDE